MSSGYAKELAKQGVDCLKTAVLECLKDFPQGLGNADIARALDLYDPPEAP